MDRQKALEIFERIKGREFSGYAIEAFIDNGKSAAVYRGVADHERAAIKIFDTELIDKFGDSTLMVRLEREQKLIGHSQPNLVRMLGAGVDDDTGHHFLVLEYLEGRSLADALDEVPEEQIGPVIRQVAGAAHFLETLSLAHRDIKPANILISPDFKTATLLDLGVLRPVGEAGLTDGGGPTLFVGTNQYASPEFALRKEEDTPEGWRAVTFYQLGGVLHDLIMRKPLFFEHLGVPARLAQAVQTEVVEIRSRSVPPWLVALAQNCLVKSADTRLRLVNWDSFEPKQPRRDRGLELRERIRQRASAAATVADERKRYPLASGADDDVLLRTTRNVLQEALRAVGRGDPPLGRRIVYEVGEPTVVRCDFEPSERIGLPAGLTVCLRPEVMDATSRIVRISGNSQAAVQPSDWCPEELDTLYEGRLDEQEIDQQVGLYVLIQVDAAQSGATNGEG